MPVSSVLRGLPAALLLVLVMSSPIDPIQDSFQVGTTTKTNAEIIDSIQGKTAIQFFCGILPSAWGEAPEDPLILQGNEHACKVIKARSIVNVFCSPTSSLSVTNPHDEDKCMPYSEPPSEEYMAELCEYGIFHSALWVEDGLEMSYQCEHIGPPSSGDDVHWGLVPEEHRHREI